MEKVFKIHENGIYMVWKWMLQMHRYKELSFVSVAGEKDGFF